MQRKLCVDQEGVVARAVDTSVLCAPLLSLAGRHGAGSRKAALKPTMSLYGNDRMRRHFPFVLRLCAVLARALPLEADAANCTGSESAARSRVSFKC